MGNFKEVTIDDSIWYNRDEPIYNNIEISKDNSPDNQEQLQEQPEQHGGKKPKITKNENDDENETEESVLNELEQSDDNTNDEGNDNKQNNENVNENVNENTDSNNEGDKPQVVKKESLSNLFEDLSNVELEVEEEVPDTDEPYLPEDILKQDLFNEMLSDLPTYKQTNPRIQQEIYDRIDVILNMVKTGTELDKQPGYEDYPDIFNQYLNGEFTDPTIIPVILDKKQIYRKVETDKPPDFDIPQSEYITDSPFPPNTIDLKDQATELQQLTQLEKQLYNQEILYDQYMLTLKNLIAPYVIQKEWQKTNPAGYTVKPQHSTLAFRYQNWETTMWEYRQTLANEKINIIGFLVLQSPTNNTSTTLHQQIKIKQFKSQGKNTIITTTSPHELQQNDPVTLVNTPLDLYLKTEDGIPRTFNITAITATTFTIPFDTSEIILPTETKKDLEHGDVYAKERLVIKTVNWTKKRNTPITLTELPVLILIEPMNILSDTYEQILRQTIPTLKSLAGYYNPHLEKLTNMSDLPELLNWSQLNSHTANIIKDYIKKNIDKFVAKKPYELLDISDKNENKHAIMPEFLSDALFYSKDITEVYTYPQYPLPTALSRINYLLKQPDYGEYYFKWLISKNKLNKKTNIVEELEQVKKEIEKQTKMDDYFLDTCETVVKEYASIKEMQKDKTQYPDKSRALLLNPPALYEYVKDTWQKVDDPPATTSLEQLCFFASVKDFDDISKLDYNKLKCQLSTQEKCTSKRLARLLYRQSVLEEQVPIYNMRKKTTDLNALEKVVRYRLRQLKMQDIDAETDDGNETNEENETDEGNERRVKKPDDVQRVLGMRNTDRLAVTILELLTKITAVRSYRERRQLLFRLIERDGILINNMLYSRKYGSRLICGHWYFLKLIANASDNGKRNRLLETMLNRFGDGGSATMGFQTCRICGQYLDRVKFSEHSGFDDDGHLKRERTIMPDAVGAIQDIHADTRITDFQTFCEGTEFKEETDKLAVSKEVCKYMHTMSTKLNLPIWKTHFMEILVDVSEKYRRLPSKDRFIQMEKQKLRKQQMDERKIEFLEKKQFFTTKYEQDIMSLKWAYFATRFLILLQTSIPPYHITRPSTSCVLEGIDGEKGTEYIVCLLEEMKSINPKYKDKFKENFVKILNDEWKTTDSIRLKYVAREKYDKTRKEQQLIEDAQFKERLDLYKTGTPTLENVQLEDETAPKSKSKSKKRSALSDTDVVKQRRETNKRITYLALRLMEMTHEAVMADAVDVVNPTQMENACCFQSISEASKHGYYGWISQDALDTLQELQQLQYLYQKRFGFMNKGAYHRHYLPTNQLPTNTDNALFREIKLPEDNGIVMAKFLLYCHTEPFAGEEHYFVSPKEPCVKCGLTQEQIKAKQYTAQDFNRLQDAIRNRQDKQMDLNPRRMYTTDPVNRVIGNAPNPLPTVSEIQELISSLVQLLLKTVYAKADKGLVKRYVDILMTMGANEKYYETERRKIETKYTTNSKLPVSNENNNENNNENKMKEELDGLKKAQYQSQLRGLKLFINDYLRRDISMIRNRTDLTAKYNVRRTMMGPSQPLPVKEREELLDLEYATISKLEPFLKEKKAFMELELAYSARDVDNIVADNENVEETINALRYWLVVELNGMMEKTANPGILAEFMIYLMDKYEEDMGWHNMSRTSVHRVTKTITTQEARKQEQLEEKQEIRKIMDKQTRELDEVAEETGVNPELEEENLREDITLTLKKKYIDQHGEEPSEDVLEDMRDEYMRQMKYERDVVDEDYDLEGPHEGLEIVQVGDEYGEIGQGDIDRAGDGISDFSQDVLDYHGVD